MQAENLDKDLLSSSNDSDVLEDSDTSNVIEESEEESEGKSLEETSTESESEETDEVEISIGEASPPQDNNANDPDLPRHLRKVIKEQGRKLKEYEAKLQSIQVTEEKPLELGKKPTLESFDYDADRFELALADWYEKKRQFDIEQEQRVLKQKQQEQAWNNRLQEYGKLKTTLKVKDYDDSEEMVRQLFSVTQQGIILQGCENPAIVVYALGKHHKKAEELSKISDPVKFSFSIAKLEQELKVTPKRTAVSPEKTVSGNGRVSGSVDSTLERLRKEAERTGNYTEVNKYKSEQRKR